MRFHSRTDPTPHLHKGSIRFIWQQFFFQRCFLHTKLSWPSSILSFQSLWLLLRLTHLTFDYILHQPLTLLKYVTCSIAGAYAATAAALSRRQSPRSSTGAGLQGGWGFLCNYFLGFYHLDSFHFFYCHLSVILIFFWINKKKKWPKLGPPFSFLLFSIVFNTDECW